MNKKKLKEKIVNRILSDDSLDLGPGWYRRKTASMRADEVVKRIEGRGAICMARAAEVTGIKEETLKELIKDSQ